MTKEAKTVWQSDRQLRNGKPFLKVKEQKDGYYYVERIGKDSVAFILYDKKQYPKFGLIKEYKIPVDSFLVTAFGGSLDKELSVKKITQEEVAEEAGYKVSLSRIKYIGKRFVSTQMNQYCHLFLVNITGLPQGEKNPQSKQEAIAEVVWVDKKDIINGPDWKSQVIIQNFNRIKL